MKNINSIIISFFSLFLLFSCYEDKGNYDYKKLNEIEISGLKSEYSLNVGDTLKLEAKLSFSADSNASYTCDWKLDMDRVLSETKDLEYIIPTTSSQHATILFTITDDKTGYTNQYDVSLRISQRYANGWLVLSEKDGRSALDFFREDWVDDGEESKLVFKEFFDVYRTIEHADLGNLPMYLRPHWRQKGEELGHVIIVQKGGQGCVDLLGDNLTKSLETVKEFSQVPEDYDPKDVFYAFNFSYILNNNGRVYSRKNFSKTAFYSGYFSNYPVSYDENGELKELNVDRFIQGVNYRQSDGGFVLTYEKANKRFLALRDMEGYWGPDRSGEIVKIESDDYEEDFIPLHNTGDNELFFSYGFAGSSYGTQGLYNIYRTPQGKYIEQQFNLSLNVGGTTSMSINSKAQRDFPDGYLDENSIVDVPDGGGSSGYGSSYVFISKGNKLYYYSRVNDDQIVLSEYYTFDSNVVALEDQHWQNEKLAVGLDNGDIYFMDISAEAIAGKKEKILHKVSKPSGNIKQILYKSGSIIL